LPNSETGCGAELFDRFGEFHPSGLPINQLGFQLAQLTVQPADPGVIGLVVLGQCDVCGVDLRGEFRQRPLQRRDLLLHAAQFRTGQHGGGRGG